jgi:hypothetical protein
MANQKHTSKTVQELLEEDPTFGAVAEPGKLPIRPLLVKSGWHSSYRDLAEVLQSNPRITVGKSIASVVRAGQTGLSLDQADQWAIVLGTDIYGVWGYHAVDEIIGADQDELVAA